MEIVADVGQHWDWGEMISNDMALSHGLWEMSVRAADLPTQAFSPLAEAHPRPQPELD